jgi:hypothetical protein
MGERWLKADLFFLDNALRHGMSAEKVAGFLGRPADEVREKAQQLIIADEVPVAPRE